MHYSIIIQGKPSNGSFTWDNPYRFNNPYITMMKVLLTPNSDSLFSNIDQTNTVSNDKGEDVIDNNQSMDGYDHIHNSQLVKYVIGLKQK